MPAESAVLVPRKHIPSLDGLRGIAITLVFLHHYYSRDKFDPVSLLASLGWVGVDVFFVLSGFLITGILFDTLSEPNQLKLFFARRSLRLFPVYFVMIALVVIFSRPLHVPLEWRDIPFFLYAVNLCDALGWKLNFGPYLNFNHIWSLAIEEQFYLIWAPLAVLLATRGRILKACAIGICAAILIRFLALTQFPPHVIYVNLPARMDSLLSGGIFALALRGPNPSRWLNRRFLLQLLAAGLAILAVACFFSRSLNADSRPTLMLGYVGNDLWCTALLGFALQPKSIVSRVGSLSALRFLGRYSYGFYLWHEIPWPYVSKWMDGLPHGGATGRIYNLAANLAYFAVCLLVAILSYHLIEQPFLKMKRYFSYTRNTA